MIEVNRRGAVRILMLNAAFVVIAAVAYFLLPPGILRAVLTLPALLWVPGRSVAAALRLARPAGPWTVPLSVVLSVLTVISVVLAVNLVAGSVPLAVLPIVVSVLLLPLCLLDDGWAIRSRSLVRFSLVGAMGLLASALIVGAVVTSLPSQQPAAYLEFSLSGEYAGVTGPLTVADGQTLRIPLAVIGSGPIRAGLVVTAEVNGIAVSDPTPVVVTPTRVSEGHVEMRLTAPSACLSRASFVLHDGNTVLRTVDLYLQQHGGRSCVGK